MGDRWLAITNITHLIWWAESYLTTGLKPTSYHAFINPIRQPAVIRKHNGLQHDNYIVIYVVCLVKRSSRRYRQCSPTSEPSDGDLVTLNQQLLMCCDLRWELGATCCVTSPSPSLWDSEKTPLGWRVSNCIEWLWKPPCIVVAHVHDGMTQHTPNMVAPGVCVGVTSWPAEAVPPENHPDSSPNTGRTTSPRLCGFIYSPPTIRYSPLPICGGQTSHAE